MSCHNIKSILITDDVSEKCIEILENNDFLVTKNTKLSNLDLVNEIKKYDCLIVRSATKVTAEILQSAKSNLKLIARAGTGVDNIDVNEASKLGILVMNALGSNTISVAELTCCMILSLARRITEADNSIKQEKWERSKFLGSEIYNKTLGIIGLGRIGKEVAQRMASFGMKIIGYDPIISYENAKNYGIDFKSLEDIWTLSDFISIHVPLLSETKNLINQEVINKCKKNFKIINCARGGIIDEEALLSALKSGHCSGAALDVFNMEPPKNFELIKNNNVICTPHIGANTIEAQSRVAIDIAEQIVHFVKNKKLDGLVNAEILSELK